MQTIPLSLARGENNPIEGEHNTNIVKLTLSEELRGYSMYIIRRTDGYGETSDSERLYEQNGEITMKLTEDILRGKSLKLQVIAFSEDFEKISKSEIVEIPVDPSLYLTGNNTKQRNLLVEMVQALERADIVADSMQAALDNACRAVESAKNAVENANSAIETAKTAIGGANAAASTANEAAGRAEEAAENVQDGADGTTFTPSVDSDGNLSWENSDNKPNPPTVNIKGAKGAPGFEEWIEMGAEDTTAELEPNKLYVFPTMTSLTYSFTGDGEYHFVFFSGETPTEIIHPQNVLTGNLTIEPNRVYEISIIKNSMGGLLLSESWEARL